MRDRGTSASSAARPPGTTSAPEPEFPPDRRRERREGALLGVVSGPAAGFGASWSGIGDGRAHAWLFAALFGALLGAASWPVFAASAGPTGRPGPGFSSLFGFSTGLLAGALAAFPMGAVMGSLGGALGAATVASVLRLRAHLGRLTVPVALALGALLPLLSLWAWTR